MSTREVIIIGDSTHNTLSAVRSFGEAGIQPELILVCTQDFCCVQHSRYLRKGHCHIVAALNECMPLLETWKDSRREQILITTFDAAAEWVDAREPRLSQWFRTPCRGKQLGNLFNKAAQCKLAQECGFDVPYSVIYERGMPIPANLPYPIITKPLVSSAGGKEDIHICSTEEELEESLKEHSHCDRFLVQQFIEKEYELDVIGVRADKCCVVGGAVRKYRHWPREVGAGAYGVFERGDVFGLDEGKIGRFLELSGYHGPFSTELLCTKDGKLYFMEVNFRNEGLAYVSTCAGANLHALYVDKTYEIDWKKVKKTYMMNHSLDFLYVKQKELSFWRWFRDFLRTRCFINICFSDLGPAIAYYKSKLFRKS